MSEDLTTYLKEAGVKVNYLHSEIKTLERIEIIRDLRLGVFDVLVGINLLREGLDIPEVSLVAILDADKEGFLRSQRSLIQTIGRKDVMKKGASLCMQIRLQTLCSLQLMKRHVVALFRRHTIKNMALRRKQSIRRFEM